MSKPVLRIIASVLLLALGAGGGIAVDRLLLTREGTKKDAAAGPSAASPDGDEPEPAAVVHTVAAKQGELSRTIEGFGTAINPPTATIAEAWPADLLITRVLVQPGQHIDKDEPFAEVASTRDAETQLAGARLAMETSQKAVDLAQQRLDRGLATRPELLTAQTALEEARQRLDRLSTGLPPKDGRLRARGGGIVGAVRAQAGATLAAGSPIIEITSGDIAALIGIDPADAPSIAVGQTFEVTGVDDRVPGRWRGTVVLAAPGLNPATRLAEVTLALAGGPMPRVGVALRARAEAPGASGVLVPRAALVPEGDGMIVYIVRDGTARPTPVTVAMRGRDQVVLTSGPAPGDHVIVSGQSQLTSGATVREVVDKPTPPAPAPPAHPVGDSGADH